MPYTRTDEDEDWINEAPSMSDRRSRAQIVAREGRSGRVQVEIPPYVVNAPEWAARWGETAPPVGTVLRWYDTPEVEPRIAICVGDDEWCVSRNTQLQTFPQVARGIGNSPCDMAVDWREIPTVEARPAGDDAVKDWASQFLAPAQHAAPETTEGH